MAARQYTRGNYGWSHTVTAESLRADYEGAAMSAAAIGTKYGVSEQAVLKALERYGIPRRRMGHNGDCVRGAKNRHWKGNKVGYVAAHDRIRRRRGSPLWCEACPNRGGTARQYHWANRTGRYYDPADYMRLCVNCHRQFDNAALARGERNGAAKLTAGKVRQIRRLVRLHSVNSLAKAFGVARKTIDAVVERRTWAHVA